jgi:hypothetical protein
VPSPESTASCENQHATSGSAKGYSVLRQLPSTQSSAYNLGYFRLLPPNWKVRNGREPSKSRFLQTTAANLPISRRRGWWTAQLDGGCCRSGVSATTADAVSTRGIEVSGSHVTENGPDLSSVAQHAGSVVCEEDDESAGEDVKESAKAAQQICYRSAGARLQEVQRNQCCKRKLEG